MKVSWRLIGLTIAVLAWAAAPVRRLSPSYSQRDTSTTSLKFSIWRRKAQTEDIARQVDAKAHAQIALVTIHSLDGEDIESFAVDLFKKWRIGDKTTNRGVLILYVIQDRRSRIEVGYELEPILPDGKVGSFEREAAPLMRSGDYSKALLLVTSRVASVIAEDAGVQIMGMQAQGPLKSLLSQSMDYLEARFWPL